MTMSRLPHNATRPIGAFALLSVMSVCGIAFAAEQPSPTEAAPEQKLYVREIRVLGGKSLPRLEIEEAVYPFLGPGRTVTDVEAARASLEKAYHEKGFSATQVVIPEQTGKGGLILLQVHEGRVGTLRIKGSRYFLPSNIRRQAPSLAEGAR